MNICPTGALFRRRDGIVDLNGESCIGCRACMAACPYDQLFIDPNTQTAEKCNFCANRIENQLQPACVSVCPTECRIFGDMDDPTSKVAQIVQREAFTVRKPEKGTGPKVFYLGADESAMRPEIAARPFYSRKARCTCVRSARRMPDPRPARRSARGLRRAAQEAWGIDLVLYLLPRASRRGRCSCRRCSGCSAIARRSWLRRSVRLARVLALTAVVLIVDLERPERFYYILTRPNWKSWIARGACFLTAHGAVGRTVAAAAGSLGWTTASHDAGGAGARRSVDRRDRLHGLPVRAGPRARSLAGPARDD